MTASGQPLWHGRFAGGPSDALLAYTVSLPFDQRLWPDDIAGSRAHVRMLAAVGLLTDDERDAVLAALDTVESGVGRRPIRLRAERRRHPHRGRASGHRVGRRGGRQAAHRAQPQRPGRHRSAAVVQARAAAGRSTRVIELQQVAARSGARAPATCTCPATRTSSAPNRCCWPITCSPTAGRWRATSTGCSPRSARLDVSPLGAGALAGSSLPLDPGVHRRRPRLRRRLRELARRGVRPRLRRRGAVRPRLDRRPPVAARRGVRAVDDRGVRLRPPRRRLRHRQLDAAAEEEPRHRRAGAGQGRAGSSATSPASSPR